LQVPEQSFFQDPAKEHLLIIRIFAQASPEGDVERVLQLRADPAARDRHVGRVRPGGNPQHKEMDVRIQRKQFKEINLMTSSTQGNGCKD
jgi:hypothetical protein